MVLFIFYTCLTDDCNYFQGHCIIINESCSLSSSPANQPFKHIDKTKNSTHTHTQTPIFYDGHILKGDNWYVSGFHTSLELVFLENCLKLHDNLPLTDFQTTSHWVLKASWPSTYFSCYVDIIIVGHCLMAWTDTILQLIYVNDLLSLYGKIACHNMHMDKYKFHGVRATLHSTSAWSRSLKALEGDYLYILGCIWNGCFALIVHL